MQVVWFKRDLRVHDHPALAAACRAGPVLPIYILEPQLWAQPDMSHRHYVFLQDCLHDLNQELRALGQRLIIKVGDAVQVLEAIRQRHGISGLWSHQETWNAWTYDRDKAVQQWCSTHHIPWHEPVQNGVLRRLRGRDGWAAQWYRYMKQPTHGAPSALAPIIASSDSLPDAAQLGLGPPAHEGVQKGGRGAALQRLHSFLHDRGEGYSKEMSSPVTAFDSCSRLSADLAFGTVSLREVFQSSQQHAMAIQQMPRGAKGKWPGALRSFSGRLRWHCHFIQKLEDEPRIEFQNMHPAYDGLREGEFNSEYYEAWASGRTGYPMVDACMRAVTATGWLNFRMRAMLMSFASYHLWLHWRRPALHLAQMFTDYEPGIHYSQAQMQSGTTGINTLRIYNPIKQGLDHDPGGVFIRRWIPELREMEDAFLHTPWQAASQMNGYPMPIVDEKIARTYAAERLYSLRKNNPAHRETAQKIAHKHGSRKSKRPRGASRAPHKNSAQGELPL